MTPKEKNIRSLCSIIKNMNTFIKCPNLSKGKKSFSTISFQFNKIRYPAIILVVLILTNHLTKSMVDLKKTLMSRDFRKSRHEDDQN